MDFGISIPTIDSSVSMRIISSFKDTRIRAEKIYDKKIVSSSSSIKTEDIEKARENLNLLSGRNHRVYTAVCVRDQKGIFYNRNVETRIKFKLLSESEIHLYLNTDEWRGKAGAYAIQGFAGGFVVKLIGSYTSVVGLPLNETLNLLNGIGFNAQNKSKKK